MVQRPEGSAHRLPSRVSIHPFTLCFSCKQLEERYLTARADAGANVDGRVFALTSLFIPYWLAKLYTRCHPASQQLLNASTNLQTLEVSKLALLLECYITTRWYPSHLLAFCFTFTTWLLHVSVTVIASTWPRWYARCRSKVLFLLCCISMLCTVCMDIMMVVRGGSKGTRTNLVWGPLGCLMTLHHMPITYVTLLCIGIWLPRAVYLSILGCSSSHVWFTQFMTVVVLPITTLYLLEKQARQAFLLKVTSSNIPSAKSHILSTVDDDTQTTAAMDSSCFSCKSDMNSVEEAVPLFQPYVKHMHRHVAADGTATHTARPHCGGVCDKGTHGDNSSSGGLRGRGSHRTDGTPEQLCMKDNTHSKDNGYCKDIQHSQHSLCCTGSMHSKHSVHCKDSICSVRGMCCRQEWKEEGNSIYNASVCNATHPAFTGEPIPSQEAEEEDISIVNESICKQHGVQDPDLAAKLTTTGSCTHTLWCLCTQVFLGVQHAHHRLAWWPALLSSLTGQPEDPWGWHSKASSTPEHGSQLDNPEEPPQHGSQHGSQHSTQHGSQHGSKHSVQYGSRHGSQLNTSEEPPQHHSLYGMEHMLNTCAEPLQHGSQRGSQHGSQHGSQRGSQHDTWACPPGSSARACCTTVQADCTSSPHELHSIPPVPHELHSVASIPNELHSLPSTSHSPSGSQPVQQHITTSHDSPNSSEGQLHSLDNQPDVPLSQPNSPLSLASLSSNDSIPVSPNTYSATSFAQDHPLMNDFPLLDYVPQRRSRPINPMPALPVMVGVQGVGHHAPFMLLDNPSPTHLTPDLCNGRCDADECITAAVRTQLQRHLESTFESLYTRPSTAKAPTHSLRTAMLPQDMYAAEFTSLGQDSAHDLSHTSRPYDMCCDPACTACAMHDDADSQVSASDLPAHDSSMDTAYDVESSMRSHGLWYRSRVHYYIGAAKVLLPAGDTREDHERLQEDVRQQLEHQLRGRQMVDSDTRSIPESSTSSSPTISSSSSPASSRSSSPTRTMTPPYVSTQVLSFPGCRRLVLFILEHQHASGADLPRADDSADPQQGQSSLNRSQHSHPLPTPRLPRNRPAEPASPLGASNSRRFADADRAVHASHVAAKNSEKTENGVLAAAPAANAGPQGYSVFDKGVQEGDLMGIEASHDRLVVCAEHRSTVGRSHDSHNNAALTERDDCSLRGAGSGEGLRGEDGVQGDVSRIDVDATLEAASKGRSWMKTAAHARELGGRIETWVCDVKLSAAPEERASVGVDIAPARSSRVVVTPSPVVLCQHKGHKAAPHGSAAEDAASMWHASRLKLVIQNAVEEGLVRKHGVEGGRPEGAMGSLRVVVSLLASTVPLHDQVWSAAQLQELPLDDAGSLHLLVSGLAAARKLDAGSVRDAMPLLMVSVLQQAAPTTLHSPPVEHVPDRFLTSVPVLLLPDPDTCWEVNRLFKSMTSACRGNTAAAFSKSFYPFTWDLATSLTPSAINTEIRASSVDAYAARLLELISFLLHNKSPKCASLVLCTLQMHGLHPVLARLEVLCARELQQPYPHMTADVLHVILAAVRELDIVQGQAITQMRAARDAVRGTDAAAQQLTPPASAATQQLSAGTQQLSAGTQQLSAGTQQSSAAADHSSVTRQQSSQQAERQSSADIQQSLAAAQQSTATPQLPSTAQQPAAAAQQPSAAIQQPAAAGQQSPATPQQPSAAAQQPAAGAQQPAAATQQPPAAAHQPAAAAQQPPAAAHQPAPAAQQPPAAARQSAAAAVQSSSTVQVLPAHGHKPKAVRPQSSLSAEPRAHAPHSVARANSQDSAVIQGSDSKDRLAGFGVEMDDEISSSFPGSQQPTGLTGSGAAVNAVGDESRAFDDAFHHRPTGLTSSGAAVNAVGDESRAFEHEPNGLTDSGTAETSGRMILDNLMQEGSILTEWNVVPAASGPLPPDPITTRASVSSGSTARSSSEQEWDYASSTEAGTSFSESAGGHGSTPDGDTSKMPWTGCSSPERGGKSAFAGTKASGQVESVKDGKGAVTPDFACEVGKGGSDEARKEAQTASELELDESALRLGAKTLLFGFPEPVAAAYHEWRGSTLRFQDACCALTALFWGLATMAQYLLHRKTPLEAATAIIKATISLTNGSAHCIMWFASGFPAFAPLRPLRDSLMVVCLITPPLMAITSLHFGPVWEQASINLFASNRTPHMTLIFRHFVLPALTRPSPLAGAFHCMLLLVWFDSFFPHRAWVPFLSGLGWLEWRAWMLSALLFIFSFGFICNLEWNMQRAFVNAVQLQGRIRRPSSSVSAS